MVTYITGIDSVFHLPVFEWYLPLSLALHRHSGKTGKVVLVKVSSLLFSYAQSFLVEQIDLPILYVSD